MPLWLPLIILAIGLYVLARYVVTTSPLTNWLMGGSVFCGAVGILLLIIAVLSSAGAMRLT